MRKFIFLMLLLTAQMVRADWVLVRTGPQNDKYYVDTDSIKLNGNIAKAWSKEIRENNSNKLAIYSAKYLNEYDCQNESSRLVYAIFYSDKEGFQIVDSVKNPIQDWTPIAPDTVLKSAFNVACRR